MNMKYNKIKTIIVIFILTIGFFAVVVEPALSFDPPPPPPPDEYIVEVTGYWCWVEYKFGPDWNTGKYAIYYNGTRIKSANMGVGLSGNRIPFTYRFSTTEAIDTISIRTLRRAKRCYYGDFYFGYFSVTEGRVRITRLGTVVYDQEGISHSPNLLPIIIPLPPTPSINLSPPPVLSQPVTRPAFFNYTVLFPFFDFVDNLFLPFAQVLLNILWIPLSLIDFVNQILIGFWHFFDTHVSYGGIHVMHGGFFDALGFLHMFFEIPEIKLIMIFGLTLVVIKLYLKR